MHGSHLGVGQQDLIIDLSPLRLTKYEQIEFCRERIEQQCEYIKSLTNRHPYQKKIELKNQAKMIKNSYITLLNKLCFH